MKAGILTFHEADSYGAVLQAYALQKALMNLGVESDFITFKDETSKKQSAASGKVGALDNLLREKNAARKLLFDEFRKNYLKCTAPLEKQEADDLNEKYDLFIAGSDQIWNFSSPAVDGRYFLPFAAPNKRFSYAASFGGNEIPDKMREWCIRQLNTFHAISVREKEGQEILRALIGRDSIVCVDPVFLLERSQWRNLTYQIEGKSYILLYLLQYDKQTIDFAKKMAVEKGIELRIVTASFMYACGFEPWCNIGVEEWLSLINCAECVVTNSFHGIAFSMIFERPFSFTKLKDNLKKRNGRIEELLKKAGVEKWEEGQILYLSEQEFMTHMDEQKKHSYDYLQEIINVSCYA
ncbi:MAG: polysaccharide pyruvyl transferase family protein [Clostridium sp.]|nr:polysaccharide pyruvyl transferase family protein [Clostridium sp.]